MTHTVVMTQIPHKWLAVCATCLNLFITGPRFLVVHVINDLENIGLNNLQ